MFRKDSTRGRAALSMISRLIGRIAAITLVLGGLGCLGVAPAGSVGPGDWQVVLAAGDDAQPVFDNATREMRRRLAADGVPTGNIHRLSASDAEFGAGAEPAMADILLRRIADLPARPGDRCLIFLTSHGERGAGLWLARSNRALTPDELARALSRGCAAVPTIVIVSACYSGGFAHGKMAQPNRVILTAARGDRPSFGCQVHRTYSFFDECLLGVLPQSATWHAVFDGTDRCVRRMERALGAQPSEPQAYFGATVAGLTVGF
jgi:Peptidase C13 family